MGKLFELLAAEKALSNAADKLIAETKTKFAKADSFFRGHSKTLTMIKETPENEAIAASAREIKTVTTNVRETVDYVLKHWSKAEDCILQKNVTNQVAIANLEFNGEIIAKDLPVDELMGLENRLKDLRGMLAEMPTLDASKQWAVDSQRGAGFWTTKEADFTTKTEKTMEPVILAPATDKHPAQVKESMKDVVVGKFETRHFSGCATSLQKAESIKVVDDLIVECRKARNRANTVEAIPAFIGEKITAIVMSKLTA